MKKTVLLSLIAAAGTGVAHADVDVLQTISKWSLQGYDSSSVDLSNLPGGDVKVPQSGNGYVFATIKMPYTGTYKLTLGTVVNCKISVVVGSETYVSGDGSIEFSAEENQEVTIKVSSLDKVQDFTLGNIQLVLSTDYDNLSAALANELVDAVIIKEFPSEVDDSFPEKLLLEEENVTLQERLDAVNDAIETLAKDSITIEEYNEACEVLGITPGKDVSEQQAEAVATIKALKADIIAHNNSMINLSILSQWEHCANKETGWWFTFILNKAEMLMTTPEEEDYASQRDWAKQQLETKYNLYLELINAFDTIVQGDVEDLKAEPVYKDWNEYKNKTSTTYTDASGVEQTITIAALGNLMNIYGNTQRYVARCIDNYNNWISDEQPKLKDAYDKCIVDLIELKNNGNTETNKTVDYINGLLEMANQGIESLVDQFSEFSDTTDPLFLAPENAVEDNIASVIEKMKLAVNSMQDAETGAQNNGDLLNEKIKENLQALLDKVDGDGILDADATTVTGGELKNVNDAVAQLVTDLTSNNKKYYDFLYGNYPQYLENANYADEFALAKEYQADITDLKNRIEAAVADYSLSKEDVYNAFVEEINELAGKIQALLDETTQNVAAQEKYNENTKVVAPYYSTLVANKAEVEKFTTPYNIDKAFQSVYNNILESIVALQDKAYEWLKDLDDTPELNPQKYGFSFDSINDYLVKAREANELFNTNLKGTITAVKAFLTSDAEPFQTHVVDVNTPNAKVYIGAKLVDIQTWLTIAQDYIDDLNGYKPEVDAAYQLLFTSIADGMASGQALVDGPVVTQDSDEDRGVTQGDLVKNSLPISAGIFAQKATQGNWDELDTYAESLNEAYPDGTPNLEELNGDKEVLGDKVSAFEDSEADNATGASSLVTTGKALDDEIIALYAKYQKVKPNYKDNQTLLDLFATLDVDLDKFYQDINVNVPATAPALATWNQLYDALKAEVDNAKAQVEALYQAVDLETKSEVDSTKTNFEYWKAQIEAWNALVDYYCGQTENSKDYKYVPIRNNENNWDQCQDYYHQTTQCVTDIIDKIRDNYSLDVEVTIDEDPDTYGFNGTYQVGEIINELLDPMLTEAAVLAKGDYEKFKDLVLWSTDTETSNVNFTAIREKAKALLLILTGDYNAQVDDLNHQLADQIFGSSSLDNLTAFYNYDVKEYNQFWAWSNLENLPDSYQEGLQTLLSKDKHIIIFKYAKPINTLKAAIEKLLNDAIPATSEEEATLLKVEDFQNPDNLVSILVRNEDGTYEYQDETLYDAFFAIRGGLQNYLVDLQGDVESYCVDQYNAAVENAESVRDTTKQNLANAGVLAQYLNKDGAVVHDSEGVALGWQEGYDDATADIVAAQTKWNNAHGVGITPSVAYQNGHVAEVMNFIFTYLTQSESSFSGEAISTGAWNHVYDETCKDIKALYSIVYQWVKDYTVDGSINGAGVIGESYKKIISNLQKAAKLDAEAQNDVNQSVLYNPDGENIKSLLERLAALKANADKAYEAAKAEVKNLKQIAADKAGWMSRYDQLVEDFNDLRNDISGLSSFAGINTSGISMDLDTLKKAIESYSGSPYQSDNIEDLFNSIQEKIQNTYVTAFNGEKGVVENLLNDLYADYNNKRVDPEVDQVKNEEYGMAIAALRESLAEILAGLVEPTDITYEEGLEQLMALEQKVIDLSKENIKDFNTPTTSAENKAQAIEALDNAANEAQDAINAAITALQEAATIQADDEEEVARLQGEIDSLQKLLDEIKAEYSDENNPVVDQFAYLNGKLNAVLNGAVDLAADISDLNYAWTVSNEKAVELTNEIYSMQTRLKEVSEVMDTYYSEAQATTDFFASDIAYVKESFKALFTQVTMAKEAHSLTDESTLNQTVVNKINSVVDLMEGTAANRQINYVVNVLATNALQSAYNEIFGNTPHANQEDLENAWNELSVQHFILSEKSRGCTDPDQANPDFTTSYETEDGTVVTPSFVGQANDIIEACTALLALAEDKAYVVGDIDGDKEVTISDYLALLNAVLADDTEIDKDDKTSLVKDVNADGRVNVADLTTLVKILFGEAPAEARRLSAAAAEAGSSIVSVVETAQNGNNRTLAIELESGTAFSSVQFDVILKDGMRIANEGPGEFAEDLKFHSQDLGNGRHRIVLESFELNTTKTGKGAMVQIQVVGSGELQIAEGYASDTQGRTYKLASDNAGTSAIDSITNGLKNGIERIYDAGGKLLKKVQRGINIIINNDGTTSKTINNK